MPQSHQKLKEKLREICDQWLSEGLPTRQGLESTADALSRWKQDHRIDSIWTSQPLMLTATLDDGIGQGIQIIECYAGVIGLDVKHIGLLQKPKTIIDQCRKYQPDFLGLTVLQLDSDEALAKVGHHRPAKTRLIAGGPVFKFDIEMAAHCKVDFVAPNVAHFIDYLLRI